MTPSVKAIRAAFNPPRGVATKIKRLISGVGKDRDLPEKTREWIRRCYHRPDYRELVAHAVDVHLDGFGVEVIRGRWICHYFYGDAILEYSNQGETYAATMYRELPEGDWRIGTWGDWVERNQRRIAE